MRGVIYFVFLFFCFCCVFFFFKQKTAYEISACLVGSEMCIRDRGRVGMVVQGMICIVLLLIFFLSPHPWCSAILMALCTAGLFAVSSPEQVLIIRVAPGGEMLGGACVQMAFNLGNAIGAYVGGLALGGGYRYPALAGVPFALTGFILFVIFYKKFQSRY